MSEPSAVHSSFGIERSFDAPVALVFDAWSTMEAKARWFHGPEGWTQLERSLDFRPGGRERLSGAFPDGHVSTFDGVYFDIVPERRIVYAYEMHLGEKRISVSLATVALAPAGKRTRLTFTEQVVFLDGFDDAGGRERGTAALLDQLGASVRAP